MHVPVLLKEALQYLNVGENKNFIDATLDGGGTSWAVLKATEPRGKLLGIDWDPNLCSLAAKKLEEFKNRAVIANKNYAELKSIAEKYGFIGAHGIIFDFGLSNYHFESSGRGFSFQRDEPLDMRFNPAEQTLTAEKIINSYSRQELEKIFKEFGQERYAAKIASAVERSRKIQPIKTAAELVSIIEKSIPPIYKKSRLNPSTKVFQALRIEANRELENIKKVLPQTLKILKPGSRIVFISFHSLEDKIIKDFLKQEEKNGSLAILTKKPVVPSDKEINANPKSRSAKLRAAEVL